MIIEQTQIYKKVHKSLLYVETYVVIEQESMSKSIHNKDMLLKRDRIRPPYFKRF